MRRYEIVAHYPDQPTDVIGVVSIVHITKQVHANATIAINVAGDLLLSGARHVSVNVTDVKLAK